MVSLNGIDNLEFHEGSRNRIWPGMMACFVFVGDTCSLRAVLWEISEKLTVVVLPNIAKFPPGLIPHDGVPRQELVTIALPVTIILSFLNIFGIMCAMICLLFNIIFRKKRFSPIIMHNNNYYYCFKKDIDIL